jgi:hypothetical protein
VGGGIHEIAKRDFLDGALVGAGMEKDFNLFLKKIAPSVWAARLGKAHGLGQFTLHFCWPAKRRQAIGGVGPQRS